MPASTWIKGVWRSSGLATDRKNHLYQYRCGDSDFADVEKLLRQLLPNPSALDRLHPDETAAFCLYAAEWWRRYYTGGPWAWDGIFASLGLASPSNKEKVYRVVARGLEYWGLSLLQLGSRRAFLITLACEGGLPLQLIRREGKYLRLYFRALLEEFQLFRNRYSPEELAERCDHYLPVSLRQDVVYRLCGDLIEQIWQLRSELGEVANPLERLDQSRPGWRTRLPLRLDDETAESLLKGLLSDVVAVSRSHQNQLRASTFLERRDGRWGMYRRVRCPRSIEAEPLAALLGTKAPDLPPRFQLYAKSATGARRLLAMATQRSNARAVKEYLLEAPHTSEVELSGESACAELYLVAVFQKEVQHTAPLPGGAALPELPWVFTPGQDEENSLAWLGAGSLRTKYPEVFLLTRKESELSASPGRVEQMDGVVEDRLLYLAQGTIHIREGTERFVVQIGAESEEKHEYAWRGPMASLGPFAAGAYLGVPSLWEIDERGPSRHVPREALQWRPRHGSHPWQPLSASCLGEVIVRYRHRGAVRLLSRLCVLPPGAKIACVPGSTGQKGGIELAGFEGCDPGISDPAFTVSYQKKGQGAHRLEVSAKSEPPLSLDLHLRWPLGQSMRLSLPFPSTRARFWGTEGQPLPDGALMSIERLGGVRAQLICPPGRGAYVVRASLCAKDISRTTRTEFLIEEPLLQVSEGEHELELRQIQKALSLRFAISQDLDAYFELSIFPHDGSTRGLQSLRVARYQGTLCPSHPQHVDLSTETLSSLTPEALARLRVEARPLWEPTAPPEALPRTAPWQWEFAPERRAPGPWLLLGWEGSWCSLRPLLWTVPSETQEPLTKDTPVTIEAITRISAQKEREGALSSLLEQLANDASHGEWKKLEAFLDTLRELPATTFDVVKRLAENPEACALALCKLSSQKRGLLWEGLEQLPFFWHLVPVRVWRRALGRYHTLFVSSADAEGNSLQDLFIRMEKEQLQQLRQSLFEHSVGLQGVLDWVLQKMGISLPVDTSNPSPLVIAGANEGAFARKFLEDAKQDLLRLHADREWPLWANQKKAQRLLLGTAPAWLCDPWLAWARQLEDHRLPALLAPVCTALAAVWGVEMPSEIVFDLRRLREFDTKWFDEAYSWITLLALLETDPQNPERLS